jgi:hypothetical protein
MKKFVFSLMLIILSTSATFASRRGRGGSPLAPPPPQTDNHQRGAGTYSSSGSRTSKGPPPPPRGDTQMVILWKWLNPNITDSEILDRTQEMISAIISRYTAPVYTKSQQYLNQRLKGLKEGETMTQREMKRWAADIHKEITAELNALNTRLQDLINVAARYGGN